jgi:hypothetical protein
MSRFFCRTLSGSVIIALQTTTVIPFLMNRSSRQILTPRRDPNIRTTSFSTVGIAIREFRNAYRFACEQARLTNRSHKNLRQSEVNDIGLGADHHFSMMARFGRKTMSVFKRYNLVAEEELHDMKWEVKKGTMDTYVDTKAEGE